MLRFVVLRAWRWAGLSGLLLGFASGPAAAQSLEEALATAYATNPTLQAARAALRTTNEQVPQALSNWRPRVTLQGSGGVQELDSTSGRSTLSREEDSVTTFPLEAELSVTQPLYRGGRTQADTRRAEATVWAQRASLANTEQDILFRVASSYVDVWRDQSVLELNQSNERVLSRQLEATRDRFEVGEVTRTDVAQSESRLASATGGRVRAEGDLSSSRALFQELVGFAAGVLESVPPVDGLPASQDELLALARDNNPAVVQAMFAEEAERHNVRLQFGQMLPELSLVGSLSHSQDTTSTTDETDRARVVAQLSVPLYQQGFVSSQIREAKQRASQRRVEIDEARRRVEQEAISAWEALQTARAQIVAFRAEVESAGIALEGVRQENAVGARTILDILDAEQEYLDAQVNLVRAQRDEIVASYQVLQAAGRMTARNLNLPVTLYDPQIDLEKVRDVWFGFGSIPD
ncbi:MAG: TolC family outer membrane protein [Kiloniellales bacterium]